MCSRRAGHSPGPLIAAVRHLDAPVGPAAGLGRAVPEDRLPAGLDGKGPPMDSVDWRSRRAAVSTTTDRNGAWQTQTCWPRRHRGLPSPQRAWPRSPPPPASGPRPGAGSPRPVASGRPGTIPPDRRPGQPTPQGRAGMVDIRQQAAHHAGGQPDQGGPAGVGADGKGGHRPDQRVGSTSHGIEGGRNAGPSRPPPPARRVHTRHVEETRAAVGGDHAPAEAPETGPDQLIARFLSGRPQATARAYAADLEDLARFHGTSVADAVRSLLLGPEIARGLVLDYAVELRRRGLAPATARRRLATLRSLLAMARQLGVVAWELELPTEREVELAAAERVERERSSYLFPRHPGEADRLDLQHHALREALGRNYLAPISSPGRVLDVGTGTGQWGFEVCWEHPEALVVGLDLVPGRAEHPSGYRHVRGNVLQGLPSGTGSST